MPDQSARQGLDVLPAAEDRPVPRQVASIDLEVRVLPYDATQAEQAKSECWSGSRPLGIHWPADPAALALEAATWRRSGSGPSGDLGPGRVLYVDERGLNADDPKQSRPKRRVWFCTEIGRELLLEQFTLNEWVLRRVEKVHFRDELHVSRNTSIELVVPDNAPVLVGEDGRKHWLVPVSIMRRRTLVNLDFRDEGGRSISLLGLRFTQKLDEAMLRAAALLSRPGDGGQVLPVELENSIEDLVSGERDEVKAAKDAINKRYRTDSTLKPYINDVFRAVVHRLLHNFTLYVTLPVDLGRHRLLRLAFDESPHWTYQQGELTQKKKVGPSQPQVRKYTPLETKLPGRNRQLIPARMGFNPTRVRFLTPSAENCASYHFEFTAPPGLRISKARLLAGRPNLPPLGKEDRALSFDGADNAGEMVGLHAVEIPHGSLCRTQVDLRISSKGWLSTLTVSCLAAFLAVLAVCFYVWALSWKPADWNNAERANIFVLLLTVSAGAATYVAHSDSRHVTARMITPLRATGAIAISVPVILGTLLVFFAESLSSDLRFLPGDWQVWQWLAAMLVIVEALSLGIVLVVWTRSWRAGRRVGCVSPWDMTGVGEAERKPCIPKTCTVTDYDRLAEELGFETFAVGVYSAEGWHERYGWHNTAQENAVETLSLRPNDRTRVNPTGCNCGLTHDTGRPHESSHRPGSRLWPPISLPEMWRQRTATHIVDDH